VNPTWTSVPSPFTTGGVSPAPPSFPNEVCQDDSTIPCEQEWSFPLDAAFSPPVCDFTGNWILGFTVTCEPIITAAGHCPLSFVSGSYQYHVDIPFHLTTEHFCPVVFADVGLTASLASFQDHAHLISKTDFLNDATAYFVASVFSPQATIVETKLHTVKVGAQTLYSDIPAVINSGFIPENFPRSPPNPSLHPTQSWFSFVLTTGFFPVPVDGSAPFSIDVVLDVTFLDTASNMHSQSMTLLGLVPMVTGDTSSPISAQQNVGVSNPVPPAPTSSSSLLTPVAFVSVIAASGVAFVALFAFICYRYRRATPTKTMTGVVASVAGTADVSV